MRRFINILSGLGKVITLYFLMFIISLICISLSSSFNPKYHDRCVLDVSAYDLSFINKYEEIEYYQLFVSCNTLDIVINADIESKDECIALMIEFSYCLPEYSDMQVTFLLNNSEVYYFKVAEKGVVLLV